MKTFFGVAAIFCAVMSGCGGDGNFEPPDLAIHFPDMASTDFAQIQGTIDAGPCPAADVERCSPFACEQSSITGAYNCFIDCSCAYQYGCAPGHHCTHCDINSLGICQ